MESRIVILYGPSMLLSLVTDSLEHSPDLRVYQAESWKEVETLIADTIPDVLVYDLAGAEESHILSLLFYVPALVLIGLDVEANQAVLLTGQSTGSLTLERVREMVQSSSSSSLQHHDPLRPLPKEKLK